MRGREYNNDQPAGDEPRRITNLSRHEAVLASMSAEEIDDELRSERLRVVEKWESCHDAFTTLFDILNSSTMQPINRFDIKTSHVEQDKPYESYVRIWQDTQADTYKIRRFTRQDGAITPDTDPIEVFGDTYQHSLNSNHGHVATICLRNDIDGIKTKHADGHTTAGLTHYESAVFLSAIQETIMPALDKNVDTLIQLWGSIRDDGLNPVYAQAYRDYINRHSDLFL